MKSLRLSGHVFLWTGFLAGAFAAVSRTEISDDPWSTIPWGAYLAALSVAAVGVVLLRTTKRTAAASDRGRAGDVDEMAAALDRIMKQLKSWRAGEDRPRVREFHKRIDECLADDLANFCELRESLIDAHGLSRYAEIMTEFALAERTINRMWSASADGYIDEVNACLDRAVIHLGEAVERLERARR